MALYCRVVCFYQLNNTYTIKTIHIGGGGGRGDKGPVVFFFFCSSKCKVLVTLAMQVTFYAIRWVFSLKLFIGFFLLCAHKMKK